MTTPDPYSQVEDGIANRIRAALTPDFVKEKTPWQVSDNDYNLTFGADYYIVTRPGQFPTLPTSMNSGEIQTIDWTTFLHCYVRYQEKEEQWARLKTFRAAIIWTVMKYRYLGKVKIETATFDEVPDVDRIRSIEANENATYWRFFNTPENAPPNFMYQPLRIVTRQRVRFS